MDRKLYTALCILLWVSLPVFCFAQPIANFSASVTNACSPIVTQFTDLSTGSPTAWSWDLGNGATSTLQNPSTTYITPGTYTVSLTVTNGSGSNTKTVTNYITVKASPAVNFKADSSAACPPKTITFTNLTNPNAGGNVSYLWDFGDGSSSTAANPTHTYTTAGNFNVTLVATNSLGCSKTLTKTGYIPLNAIPVASFTASNNNSCTAPATVTFNNTSTNAVSYSWDFGDGSTATTTSPSHQYSNTGTYTVKLIATNAAGCSDTTTQTAAVNIGTLNAAYTTNGNNTCVNKQVTFTNTSTPATGNSTWYFGDGTSATTVNATHAYSSAGTYNAMLVVAYNGCSDTAIQTITVSSKPTANFTASSTESCTTPFNTQFNNSSTGATAYLWIFGDGTTSTASNPSKTYNNAGVYTVKLIAYNASGCTDTFTRTNYIKIQILQNSLFATPWVPNAKCAPVTATAFANNYSIFTVSNYSWNFGNGQTLTCNCPTPSTTYSTAGTYTVSVTYNLTNGCSWTRQANVTVGSKPTAGFTYSPDTVCPNQTVTFTNTSTGATGYLWDFGGGTFDTFSQTNPTYTYGTSGNKTVRLIALNGACSDTFTISNAVYVHLPTAYFGVQYNCGNRKQFTFSDSSNGANTYSWDFGDGTTSTQSGTVSHTYANFGYYTVKLTVTNTATGCTDVYQRYIRAFPLNAQFTANDTTICRGETIQLQGVADTFFTNYSWSFGDNTSLSDTAATASHPYTTNGNYTVKLVVSDAQGCKDSITKTNYIQVTGPAVNFSGTPLSGCSPLTVNFSDLSNTGGAGISSRMWTFGNGQTLTTTNTSLSHNYTNNGTYSVTLKLTDVNGCVDSLKKTNYITASKPIVGFFANDTVVCAGQVVSFTNTSSSAAASWDFGDGTTSNAYSPQHAYSQTGFYNVKLVVTQNGCKDSLIRQSYIEVKPLALTFTASDTTEPCPPLSVDFANTTSGLSSVSWNLGNGNFSNLNNPSTVYTYPGVYTVKMYGTNSLGCSDSASKTITVYGPTGTLSYSPVAGCNPLTVNFSSTNNNTQALIWDMNNGYTQTTTASTFTYTYTQTGKYLPKLVLSDGASCLVPIDGVDTIKVDEVQADFTFAPSSLCQSGTIQFTDTVYTSLTNVSRAWDFGDGTTSTLHNPSHTYTSPGTYQVKLIVANTTTCNDTITKSLTVYADPNVSAGNDVAICSGQNTTLQATGASTYSWSPATGLSCTNCANPTASPSATTTYVVTGTSANGCTETDTVTITVNAIPTISAGNNVTICPGTNANLQATGGTSYTWSPATGLSCTNCANPVASPSATTTYTVTGTDANGCTDTGVVTVTVSNATTVTTSGNTSICTGGSAQLQASGTNTYSWSPATGLSCTACPNPVASPSATTTYTVIGISGSGCADTAQVTVTVNPLPTISGGANTAICTGGATQLQATGGTSYTWSPSTGLSCTNCANPVASPSATTTYTVTGTDANGCTNTAQVTVTVNPLPAINAGNDVSICNGSSTQLQATGGVSYTWSPATALSCTNCANPTASPATNTTYTVTGTDANGCSNTDAVNVSIYAAPAISGGTNKTICAGGATQLQATGGVSYTWSPATGLSCTNCANPTASPSTTTTYTVTGTDGNGCTNTAQVTVTVNPLPTISAGSNTSICTGGSTTLQATGGTSYTWSPAAGLSCTNCANPTASPATTTTYTVTGTNANGCTNTAQVTVTVNPLPVISAGSNVSICNGNSTALQATGGVSYTWSPATGLSCTNCANPTASPATTTTYTVTGTDAKGCTNTAQVTVTVNPLPAISAGNNKSICLGSSTQLQATGGTSYTWTPTTGLSCNTCANPTANPLTTTTYTVTGTDGNGCTNNAQVTVAVNPLPTVSAGNNAGICAGSSTQLQASGAQSYVWSPATGLSCTNCPNPTATPATTTTYTVSGTNANGCTNTGTVTVTVNSIPNVTATTTKDSICDGQSALLTASGATSYTWSPATGLSCNNCPNPTATPQGTVTYIVTGSSNGCTDTAQVKVVVLGKPVVVAGADTGICEGGFAVLNASGATNLVWSPATGLSCTNCPNPIATPSVTTTYTVTATGANNCSSKEAVVVTVYPTPDVNAGDDASLCAGTPLQLRVTGASNYSWSPSTGLSCTNCPNPMANPSVQTTYKVVGIDTHGCSDSDEVVISIIEKGPVSVGPGAAFCEGQSAELSATGGTSYQWIPASGLNNDRIANPVATPVATTNYSVIIQQGNCFTDTQSVLVTVFDNPVVDAGPDQTISGSTASLNAQGSSGVQYEWTPATGLSCTGCQSPTASPERTTTYKVMVTNKAGCKAEDDVTIFVTCGKDQLFIANTFTPNGDGVNDKFFPQGKGISVVQRFRVFNRWGQVVYEAQNMPLNDENFGWDGRYKNEPLSPDVFVYILNATCDSGEPLEIKGDISLIR